MQNKVLLLLFLTTIFSMNSSLNLQIKQQECLINEQQNNIEEIKHFNDILNNYQKTNIYTEIDYDKINSLIDSYENLFYSPKYNEKLDYSKDVSYINNYIKKIEEEKKRKELLTSKDYIKDEMIRRGNMGRLYIPDVNLNVALFRSGFYDSNNQLIVDNKDSAAYLGDGTVPIIADHKDQGFNAIKKVIVNQTKAYINDGLSIETYLCVKKCNGKNTGSCILDEQGRNVSIIYDDYLEFGDYTIMYTCNENWQNVTVTFWKKL